MSAITDFASVTFRGLAGMISPRRMRGRFFVRFLIKLTVFCLIPVWLIFLGFSLLYQGVSLKHTIAEFTDMRVRDVSMEVSANGKKIDSVSWNVDKKEILKKIKNLQIGDNIFDTSPEELRKKVSEASWVKHASVRLVLPDKVVISIEERIPYAIWQINGAYQLIDKDGAIITDQNLEKYNLPIVIGEGAEKKVTEYKEVMKDFSEIYALTESAGRINHRRWSLYLYNGTIVHLAAANPRGSLERLVKLQQKNNILEKAGEIDLTLSHQTVLREKTAKQVRY